MRKLTDVTKLHELGWHHRVDIEDGVSKNVLLVSKRCYKINDCLWIRMLLLPEYLVFGFYMYLCEKTIDI